MIRVCERDCRDSNLVSNHNQIIRCMDALIPEAILYFFFLHFISRCLYITDCINSKMVHYYQTLKTRTKKHMNKKIKKNNKHLHQQRLDDIMYLAVRGPRHQLPQAHFRQLVRLFLTFVLVVVWDVANLGRSLKDLD